MDAGVEVAWVALHGRFGEDEVQGLLEVMGIPYTGPDVRCAAVTMDKIATKQVMASHPDVVMAQDWICTQDNRRPDGLSFPVVVKPSVGGSTIGIRRVEAPLNLMLQWMTRLHYTEVLIEEFVAGDEITVAVFEGKALPVVRIIPESGFSILKPSIRMEKQCTRFQRTSRTVPVTWRRRLHRWHI